MTQPGCRQSAIGLARPTWRRSSKTGWPGLRVPLDGLDRKAGYWWDLSMRQIDVSRTIVFTRPRDGRRFFEALVADTIDLGRPDRSRSSSVAETDKHSDPPVRGSPPGVATSRSTPRSHIPG